MSSFNNYGDRIDKDGRECNIRNEEKKPFSSFKTLQKKTILERITIIYYNNWILR